MAETGVPVLRPYMAEQPANCQPGAFPAADHRDLFGSRETPTVYIP
jgi:hypothetical protein